jgi:hypothetical protein
MCRYKEQGAERPVKMPADQAHAKHGRYPGLLRSAKGTLVSLKYCPNATPQNLQMDPFLLLLVGTTNAISDKYER